MSQLTFTLANLYFFVKEGRPTWGILLHYVTFLNSPAMRETRYVRYLLALLLLLAACSSPQSPSPTARTYYVGTYQLDLLQSLSPQSPVAATLPFGHRVTVLERRRQFARVRSETGAEGWVDSRNLLSPAQMANFTQLAMLANRLPSQGKATTWQQLNIHTEPYRDAPAFARISEGNLVEVVARRVLPRGSYRQGNTQPPAFPFNSYESPEGPAVTSPAEEWVLVRLSSGAAGWALSRMLSLAVPGNLYRYTEGQTITASLSLGEVRDGDEVRHHWLWATRSRGLQVYQFDELRIFAWNLARHRYETVYREKGLYGYYPIEVQPLLASPARQPAKFQFIVYMPGKGFTRRIYLFDGRHVRRFAEEPWTPPQLPGSGQLQRDAPQHQAPRRGWWSRLAEWFVRRFSGSGAGLAGGLLPR